MAKRRGNDFDNDPASKRVRTLESTPFDWSRFCLLCGEGDNPKKGIKCTIVSQGNSETVKKKVLSAANIRNDTVIKNLLSSETLNLHDCKARYHLLCYQNYISETALHVIANKEPTVAENYDAIAKNVLLAYKDKFDSGQIVFLPQLCESFINAVVDNKVKSRDDAKNIKSSFIKSKLQKVSDGELQFYSYPGKADIVASSQFPLVLLIHKLFDSVNTRNDNYEHIESSSKFDENTMVHQVAAFIRDKINAIPKNTEYFLPSEVSIGYSKSFVPEILQKLVCWIVDYSSFVKGQLATDPTIVRRILSISETIIYCTRRSHNNSLTPPFTFGLTLQLHHKFAKKSLISTLNSHGFCMTNDDLRRFLTILADKQLEKNSSVYVPSGIIHRDDGGGFIQEGDDNVDINTETIDGKNTYHAMARVLFQNQKIGEQVSVEKIPKLSLQRALPETSTASLDVAFYQKPSVRPNPPKFAGALTTLNNLINQRPDFHLADLTWALLRNVPREIFSDIDLFSKEKLEQFVPSWVPHNTHFADSKSDFTKPQYLPTINAKPSDLSTVYTTLKKGQQLFHACGQKYSVHTFDQQLFALGQIVKFDRKDELSDVILRMGTFHCSSVFNSCIGKIWGDCGLRDMLVDSGVYAANSVDQMFEGKQFFRTVRAYTLCYEVLLYLMFENFFEWLAEKDEQLFHDFRGVYENFYKNYAKGACTKEDMNRLTEDSEKVLLDLFNEFRSIRRAEIPTFQFWDDGLECFQILLQLCRAEREGDWESDKTAQACMLPYFFTCNKINYSRWLTYHLLEMLLKLPKEVENEFLNGNFSVRLTPGPFRGMYSDMAVETTVIKDTKSATGIIGFTMKDSTVLRWTVTRNELGLYSSAMDDRSNFSGSAHEGSFEHEGERESEILKDERHFRMILQHVKNHMSDPFSASIRNDALINISSGLVAPPETQEFLLNIKSTGNKKLKEFVSKRLDSDFENSSGKKLGFFDPIPLTVMKTFSETKKKSLIKVNGKIIKKFVSAESVYQRALAVCTVRKDVDLKVILSFPLTAIPSALFKPDGCRRSTDKSELMSILEKEIEGDIVSSLPVVERRRVIVIDGMAELQALSSKTFLDFNCLGNTILKNIIYRLREADEVHLVFDRYDDESPNPKQEERNRRYGVNNKAYDISGNRPLKDLKAILSNNKNKSSLTEFICDFIKNNLVTQNLQFQSTSKKIYLAGGLEPRENAFVIAMDGTCSVDSSFKCNHIDADTRLVYHVKVIQSKSRNKQIIIVESPDTDVFILLLSNYQHYDNNPEVWFYTGKITIRANLKRYIPIHCLSKKLKSSLIASLISAHALTGCDTTSSLFFIGKKTVYAILKKMTDEELNSLNNLDNVSLEEAMQIASKFISMIYDPKNESKAIRTDVTSLRFNLAILKNPSIDRLPPSKPALQKHILRCLWQINEWKQANNASLITKDLKESGWLVDEEGNISFDYYEGNSAMEYLQSFYCSCSQKNSCTTDVCPCVKADLKCCDLCSCKDSCTNREVVINVDDTI